jgi:hypothetical protein
MKHIDKDKLLAYALETLTSDVERTEIQKHLDSCHECRQNFEVIQSDINILGGVRGPVKMLQRPITRRTHFPLRAISRAAALLLFGFLAGMGASSLTHHKPINVSPSYAELSSPDDSLTSIVVPDATQIDQDYYEQILPE